MSLERGAQLGRQGRDNRIEPHTAEAQHLVPTRLSPFERHATLGHSHLLGDESHKLFVRGPVDWRRLQRNFEFALALPHNSRSTRARLRTDENEHVLALLPNGFTHPLAPFRKRPNSLAHAFDDGVPPTNLIDFIVDL